MWVQHSSTHPTIYYHLPILRLLKQGEYETALQHLASLREAVDHFFDHVMV
jgi:glycyl-tRNA synthetase beta subunit